MDLTQILAWIVGANTVINFATTAYTLMSARATKALEAITALGKKIESLTEERKTAGDAIVARFQTVESRLLKIEAEMEHLPDRKQFHELAMAVEKMAGRIDTLTERLNPVAATTARIQNLLIEQGLDK